MREYVRKALGLGIIIAIIPGCAKQSSEKNKAALSKKQAAFSVDTLKTNIDVAFQEEALRAQLDDIPTFVGSTFIFIDDQVKDGQLSFALSSTGDVAIIKDFYMQEMENLGWQKIGQLEGVDTTFIFQKPKKICMITIQSSSERQKAMVSMKCTYRLDE